MAHHAPTGTQLGNNFGVDYVISYRFADIGAISDSQLKHRSVLTIITGKSAALADFEKLVQALARLGLITEVRNGANCSLLVFVKAEEAKSLKNEVYKSR